MKIAYLCILVALLLPYIWTSIAKASGKRYDNSDPRGWLAQQTNARALRANAAQLNAFEALPGFIAAIFMAQFAGVDVNRISMCAVGFIFFRILHGVFYVGNKPSMRSGVWCLALACEIFLIVSAILKVA